jgi:hypothetical protein
MGFSAERLHGLDVPGWGSVYVVGLSAASMGLALLALGLIRPWGEVVPGWMPLLGGRRVPPLAAVIPAGLAAVLLTVLTVAGAMGWSREMHLAGSPGGAAAGLMTAAYLPLLTWGPLLGLTTLAYYLRRLGASPASPHEVLSPTRSWPGVGLQHVWPGSGRAHGQADVHYQPGRWVASQARMALR